MPHTHSIEKAKKLAGKALEKIDQEKLLPDPVNFELWYTYYAQENPELSHTLDLLIEKKKITDKICQKIHLQYLSDRRESEQVRQAGSTIQSTIQDVTGIVTNVKSATSKYNATLNDVTNKLENGISQKEMEVVLVDIMDNTQDMIRHNQTLENELTKSSQAMIALQRDLELVRKEALTDSLTNLANRKAFDAEIVRISKESNKDGTTFSLLMLDIDYFKSFNDNFGHQVGDQVLRLVARTLIDGVKGRDIAARFGGEEFAIILPDTNLQAAVKVADQLRKAVASKEIINRNSGDVLGRITLSGGVAQQLPDEKVEDIISRADAALYTAKHNGRNQITSAATPGQK